MRGTLAVTLIGILLVAILLVLAIVLRTLRRTSARAAVSAADRVESAAELPGQAQDQRPGAAAEAEQILARAESDAAGVLH